MVSPTLVRYSLAQLPPNCRVRRVVSKLLPSEISASNCCTPPLRTKLDQPACRRRCPGISFYCSNSSQDMLRSLLVSRVSNRFFMAWCYSCSLIRPLPSVSAALKILSMIFSRASTRFTGNRNTDVAMIKHSVPIVVKRGRYASVKAFRSFPIISLFHFDDGDCDCLTSSVNFIFTRMPKNVTTVRDKKLSSPSSGADSSVCKPIPGIGPDLGGGFQKKWYKY